MQRPAKFLTRLVLFVIGAALFVIYFGTPWNDQARAADWSEDPNATPITWRLTNKGAWSDDYTGNIHAILKDIRGWQRAGLDFQQTDTRADIRISMYDVKRSGSNRDEGRLVAYAIGNAFTKKGCAIFIPTGFTDTEVMTMFVNHEVGHCLGFAHATGDRVMRSGFIRSIFRNVKDGPFWPVDEEIEALRRRLNVWQSYIRE